jgi:hypothetical protein
VCSSDLHLAKQGISTGITYSSTNTDYFPILKDLCNRQRQKKTYRVRNFCAGQISCTAEARTRARNSPRELCGGRTGTRTGFPQTTGVRIATEMVF